MGRIKNHTHSDEKACLRRDAEQALKRIDANKEQQSGAPSGKSYMSLWTFKNIMKQHIPWFATMGAFVLMVFVLVGTFMTVGIFAGWFRNFETTTDSQQWVMESDAASKVDPDINAATVWSEGDPIDRMRLREMFQVQQITIKQAKAAHAVAERDIELISTGFDENRVPYAILSVKRGREQTCQVGDKILDAEVMSIFPNQVVLDLGGQRFSLNVAGNDASGHSQASRSTVEFIGDSNPGGTPSEASRHNRKKLIGLTRLKRDGDGFTVVTADFHSPLGNAGIRPGDTLLAINGILLASRTGTVLAYERLTDKNSVRVDFMRNGVSMITSVSLQ